MPCLPTSSSSTTAWAPPARCATERVVALEMGADDCLSKPFEPRELVARIHSVLRRVAAAEGPARQPTSVVAFDGWQLDREERQLTSPLGSVVPLSNAEFKLLSACLQAPRRVVSRKHLMAQSSGRDELIQTVRGAGYLFNARSVQSQAA